MRETSSCRLCLPRGRCAGAMTITPSRAVTLTSSPTEILRVPEHLLRQPKPLTVPPPLDLGNHLCVSLGYTKYSQRCGRSQTPRPPATAVAALSSVIVHPLSLVAHLFLSLILPPHLGQRNEPLDRLDHFLQAGPFQRRMGIVAAAGEIGRGQAHLGQPRAVRAAADDGPLGRPAQPPEGLLRRGPRPAARAPAPRPCCGTAARSPRRSSPRESPAPWRRPICRSRSASSANWAASKSRSRIFSLTSAHAAGNFIRVQEALAALGRLRRELFARQPGDEVGRPPGRR